MSTITTKDGTQIYYKDWGIIHGDDDQIVPIGASAYAAVKIAPKASLKVYPGASHGFCSTHKDQVNADLLEFLKS